MQKRLRFYLQFTDEETASERLISFLSLRLRKKFETQTLKHPLQDRLERGQPEGLTQAGRVPAADAREDRCAACPFLYCEASEAKRHS